MLRLCFDLDDTIVPNSFRYNVPTWRCGALISEALGHNSPYFTELLDMYKAIDAERLKTMGFARDRFPGSWALVYDQACERAGEAPNPGIRERVYARAASFSEGPFRPFPGAFETLQFLGYQHELYLVTAGDEALQREKIAQAGIEHLFMDIHIVPVDKKPVLADLSNYDPRNTVMIGDSKSSDIKPALELGMRAIWVPSNTWTHAHAELSDEYHVIRGLSELPDLLSSWS